MRDQLKRALHRTPEIVIQTPDVYDPVPSEWEVEEHEDYPGHFSFHGEGLNPYFPLKHPYTTPKIKFLTQTCLICLLQVFSASLYFMFRVEVLLFIYLSIC